MASTREAIIAVQGYQPESPSFKLLRLVATRDGSYSISAPYHPARSGLLFKVAIPAWAEGSPLGLTVAPQTKYRVDVPVKMSFHPSGFVQFSSVGPAPIRSGRAKFYVPRGLGIEAHDIRNPIDTGPTWGATFFNASECDVVTGTEHVPVMLFRRRRRRAGGREVRAQAMRRPAEASPATSARAGRPSLPRTRRE